jgi:hypothetical protein
MVKVLFHPNKEFLFPLMLNFFFKSKIIENVDNIFSILEQ